jgi:dihydrofolate synthase/folylpolyglutamate synthase
MMPAVAATPLPNVQSSLTQWLDYLMHLHAKPIDMGLARVSQVAHKLDIVSLKPQTHRLVIAGTNGKGSNVALVSAIMQAAGYQVGCYTSPHLVRFNERSQINGKSLSDAQWIDAFVAVEKARGAVSLSFFEFTTLAAIWFFHQQPLDLLVLEVGLGGRLDAVNAVDNTSCIITAIDLDHQAFLGDNREAIGFEKAGVMRPHQLCVCSDPHPPQSLLDHAQQLDVSLRCLGQDYSYHRADAGWFFYSSSKEPSQAAGQVLEFLPLPALLGDFQLQNAAGVLAWLDAQTDFEVRCDAIKIGLEQVKHPGRLQRLQLGQQAWLLDVAHNPQAAEQLAVWLEQDNAKHTTKPVAIFSALADKDIVGMINKVAPHVAQWILLDLRPQDRATDPVIMQQHLSNITTSQIADSAKQAIELAQAVAVDRVVVFGSFITVGAIMAELEQHG